MVENQLVLYTKPTPQVRPSFVAHILYTIIFATLGIVQAAYLLPYGHLAFWALFILSAVWLIAVTLIIKAHLILDFNIHPHIAYVLVTLALLVFWNVTQPSYISLTDFHTKDSLLSVSIHPQKESYRETLNLTTYTEFRFICYCRNLASPIVSSIYFTDGLTVRNASADLGSVHDDAPGGDVPKYRKLEVAVPKVNPEFREQRRDRAVELMWEVIKEKAVFDVGLLLWSVRKGIVRRPALGL
ncbi:hypothetical protein HDV00_004456 [Rhizophlyctis rosea]|nr:hypothetical protein HDV00_004456 [Rhizophlyctis rosea]